MAGYRVSGKRDELGGVEGGGSGDHFQGGEVGGEGAGNLGELGVVSYSCC